MYYRMRNTNQTNPTETPNRTERKMDPNALTFGIEIETHVPYGAVRVGGYRQGSRDDRLPRGWQVKYDCSISAPARRQGAEFVSPVLRGAAGIKSVIDAVQAINDMGGKVNASCGLHVHVGFDRNDTDTLRRLINLVANFEGGIYAATGTPNRMHGTWCRSTNEQADADRVIERGRSGDRYRLLNLTNLMGAGHGSPTVEFRAFSGSLNITKIIGYIRLCVGLVQRSHETQRKVSWTGKAPSAKSPTRRSGEGQTQLTRLFYQIGWIKGRRSEPCGNLTHDDAPDLKACKKELMRLAKKFDQAAA